MPAPHGLVPKCTRRILKNHGASARGLPVGSASGFGQIDRCNLHQLVLQPFPFNVLFPWGHCVRWPLRCLWNGGGNERRAMRTSQVGLCWMRGEMGETRPTDAEPALH